MESCISLDVEIVELCPEKWSQLIQVFSDASVYQTHAYWVQRWGKENIIYLAIKKDKNIIGACIVPSKRIFLNLYLSYIFWGPLWRKYECDHNIDNYKEIIKSIKERLVNKNGNILRIVPHEFEENENGKKITKYLLEEGFHKVNHRKAYRTYIVDLRPPLAELRKNLNQKWRNQLNRAEKNNLKIIEGTDDSLFRNFLTLQKEMQNRKKYTPGVNYNTFFRIQQHLHKREKMRIFVCFNGDIPVSATIISTLGSRSIYLLGATGNAGLRLKGSYLLQWRIIEWCKDNGIESYDLGGINPVENPGVHHFKAGLNGSEHYHIGHFEAVPGHFAYLLLHGYEKINVTYKCIKKLFNRS